MRREKGHNPQDQRARGWHWGTERGPRVSTSSRRKRASVLFLLLCVLSALGPVVPQLFFLNLEEPPLALHCHLFLGRAGGALLAFWNHWRSWAGPC